MTVRALVIVSPSISTVTLTVTDDRGAKTSTTKDVVVAINSAPVASFMLAHASTIAPLSIFHSGARAAVNTITEE